MCFQLIVRIYLFLQNLKYIYLFVRKILLYKWSSSAQFFYHANPNAWHIITKEFVLSFMIKRRKESRNNSFILLRSVEVLVIRVKKPYDKCKIRRVHIFFDFA